MSRSLPFVLIALFPEIAEAQPRLRDLSTDRPDRTESPYTVDARHVQIEMDIANVVDAVRDGAGPRSFGFGAINTKLGLSRNVDFQLVTQLLTVSAEKTPGSSLPKTTTGVSDLTARLKINLSGNDGGRSAFGMMPYLTAPVNGNSESRSLSGGLILPLALELGRGWGMGLMSQLDVGRASTGSRLQVNTIHSVTVGHDIAGPVAGYAELVAETVKTDRNRVAPTADFGLTLAANENLQFDVGTNIGMNRNADRFVAFVGVSKRY